MAENNKYHNNHFNSNGVQPNGYTTSLNGVTAAQEEDEIDLKQLLFSLWNRKWVIIGSVVICGLIAAIIAFASTPVYESDGTILISQPQNKLSGLSLGGGGLSDILSSSYGIGVSSTLNNELEVLRSRKLSLNIADSLVKERLMPNGRQYPIIFKSYPDDSTLIPKDTVAIRLRSKLTFEKSESGADVIKAMYESPSPIAASRVINIALSQYKNLSTQQKRTSANSAGSFLKTERARIQDSLKVAEEKLRVFMNNHKLVQVDTQTQEIIQQMADLEARRQEARAKLVAANSAIEQYQKELNSIKPGLAEQYSEAVGPDITKLQYAKSELEIKKQQLFAQNPNLNESSPQIASLNRQIASYKKRIKELTENLIKKSDQYLGFLGREGGIAQNISELNQKMISLQVQQKQYQSQTKVVKAQLNELRKFFNNLPDNIIDLARLKRDVKINETLFEAVTKQYAQTSLWEQSQFGLGRIIDTGFIPGEPAKPNTPLYIFIGFIVGGILGVGYVFVKEEVTNTIRGAEKMEKRQKEPLLAVIPPLNDYIREQQKGTKEIEMQDSHISKWLVTELEPEAPISESFRQLENNLIYSDTGPGLKTILITSSGKGEGKSTTIANLGIVLSEAGFNTLIIDADFRQPSQHDLFGLQNSRGINEALSGDLKLEEAIQQTVVEDLSLLPAGNRPANAAAVMRSKAFLNILTKLKDHFDFILIDTAPFGIVTDSAPILKQADGVVVVAKFGETSKVKLSHTLENLHRLNTNILGTVLTAYDYSKSNDIYPASIYYEEQYRDYIESKERV